MLHVNYDNNFLVAKITFVRVEIPFKVSVITSPVDKITFVVAEIIFKVAVISSSVAKITFVVAEITFQWPTPGLGRVLDKSTRVQVQILEKMTSTSTSTSTGFLKVLEYKYRVLWL